MKRKKAISPDGTSDKQEEKLENENKEEKELGDEIDIEEDGDIDSNDEVEALQQQVEEITLHWKRAIADYQNLEKRIQEQRQDYARFAIKEFLEKFLSVIDDLKMAQKHIQDKGLDLTLNKLKKVLQDEGLEKIETKDKEFDIEIMEAVSSVEGKKDNIVVEEHRSGYLMHGAVLRPAQVIVSKKK